METFFSVVIPLYNKEKDIASTLQSVLDQNYELFEIIVVNDGSLDNGEAIVRQFSDTRIKLCSIKNSGVSVARNSGVELASSQYIAFLDADDYWYPFHLQNLHLLVSKFPYGKWFATAYEIKHNKRLTVPMSAPPMQNGGRWVGEIDDFFKNSMCDCLAWTSAVCMRKDFFYFLGGFNSVYSTSEDVDLWIRAGIQEKIIFSNRISARYNFTGSNRISTISVLNKTFVDFDFYEKESPNDVFLKKYLDFNRYSVAIQFKMNKNTLIFKRYLSKIKLNNLSYKQRFLLIQPYWMLLLFSVIKTFLETIKIRIRTSPN